MMARSELACPLVPSSGRVNRDDRADDRDDADENRLAEDRTEV
jgi:hypothetical protein